MKLRSILLLSALAIFSFKTFSQELTFNVKTVNYGSQKHLLAIWITDSNNKFVKTMVKMSGNSYINELTNWIASSSKNVVDATTGATISTHPSSAVAYKWNCKNVSGAVVADGNYYVNAEFVEEAMGGKSRYVKYAFTVGPDATQSFTSPTTDPGKYFQNVSYSITVSAQTLGVGEVNSEKLIKANYLSNAKTLEVSYDFVVNKSVTVAVFDIKGSNVKQQVLSGGKGTLSLNNLSKGVYAIKVIGDNGNVLRKKIIIR